MADAEPLALQREVLFVDYAGETTEITDACWDQEAAVVLLLDRTDG